MTLTDPATNETVPKRPGRPRGPASRVSMGWVLAAGAAFALTAALILWGVVECGSAHRCAGHH